MTGSKPRKGKSDQDFGLTPNQLRFADLVHDGVEPEKAYYEAGYTANKVETMRSCLADLMKHTKINEYWRHLRRGPGEMEDGVGTAKFVLRHLTEIVDKQKGNASVVKALELLGKHHGLFVDLHEDVGRRKKSADEMVKEIQAALGDEAVAPLAKRLGVSLDGKQSETRH